MRTFKVSIHEGHDVLTPIPEHFEFFRSIPVCSFEEACKALHQHKIVLSEHKKYFRAFYKVPGLISIEPFYIECWLGNGLPLRWSQLYGPCLAELVHTTFRISTMEEAFNRECLKEYRVEE